MTVTLPRRHPARGRIIGSSMSAAILGVSKWSSAIDAWHRLLGFDDGHPGNALTQAGEDLEAYVLGRYAKATGHKVDIYRSERKRRRIMEGYPYLGAHLDGWDHDESGGIVVEAKTSPFGTDYGEPADGILGLPMYVRVQVTHQLMVTGAPFARVAALLRGYDFRIFDVERDEVAIEDLRDELVEWYAAHVVLMVPPPADDTEQYGSFLSRAYPADDGSILIANERMHSTLRALWDARQAKAAAERAEQEARNAIEAAMGTARVLTAPGVRISWKAHEQKRVSHDEVAAEYRFLLDSLRTAAKLDAPDAVAAAVAAIVDADLDEAVRRLTKVKGVRPFLPTFDEEEVVLLPSLAPQEVLRAVND